MASGLIGDEWQKRGKDVVFQRASCVRKERKQVKEEREREKMEESMSYSYFSEEVFFSPFSSSSYLQIGKSCEGFDDHKASKQGGRQPERPFFFLARLLGRIFPLLASLPVSIYTSHK